MGDAAPGNEIAIAKGHWIKALNLDDLSCPAGYHELRVRYYQEIKLPDWVILPGRESAPSSIALKDMWNHGTRGIVESDNLILTIYT